jgi:D-sedoheptulose 7-phosphate isomerase
VRRMAGGGTTVAVALAKRTAPGYLLAEDAGRVARCCYDMAVRFHRGGRLAVFGSGVAATDAQHVSVEFVHPVIVGKRALPAFALTTDVATMTGLASRVGVAGVFAHQLRHLGAPPDIALGISSDGRSAAVLAGLRTARDLGMLTVALAGGDGGETAADPSVDHGFVVHSFEPQIVKEVHVTTYHILWELVHVFLEQPGLLREAPAAGPGAAR